MSNIRQPDFAISFACDCRRDARSLHRELSALGFDVFLDEKKQAEMLGESLSQSFAKVFDECYRCVVFVSEEYHQRFWTKYEWSLLKQRHDEGDRFIIPIQMPGVDRLPLGGKLDELLFIDRETVSLKAAATMIAKHVILNLKEASEKRDDLIGTLNGLRLPEEIAKQLGDVLRTWEGAQVLERRAGTFLVVHSDRIAKGLPDRADAERTAIASFLKWIGLRMTIGQVVEGYREANPTKRYALEEATDYLRREKAGQQLLFAVGTLGFEHKRLVLDGLAKASDGLVAF